MLWADRHSYKAGQPNRNRHYEPARMPTTSAQPRRRCHNRPVADMNIDDNAVLYLRICGHAACWALFTICVRRDRGQRYCSPKCRLEVRRRQRHAGNRRERAGQGVPSPLSAASNLLGRDSAPDRSFVRVARDSANARPDVPRPSPTSR